MLCHPKAIGLTDALGLLDALHVSKHLCKKRLLGKVAEETLRLLRDAQVSAVKRAEEKQAEAQDQISAENNGEGESDPVPVKQGPDDDQEAAAVKDNEQKQELITRALIVEWMSAPMSLATDYADHVSEYKRPLAKLAKYVLPVVCGYADDAAATNILARLGVAVEESEKMLGDVDSKETQAVVQSSSSPLSSLSEGRV
jgi:hypothetical protein